MLSSTDLWFCSYLVNKGFKVAKYDILSRGKAKFYFDIDEEDWKKYKLEFNNSELSKFKMIIDQLKDLSY
jgi:hypothetical protein